MVFLEEEQAAHRLPVPQTAARGSSVPTLVGDS
jgi:hypothetical protein